MMNDEEEEDDDDNTAYTSKNCILLIFTGGFKVQGVWKIRSAAGSSWGYTPENRNINAGQFLCCRF